MQDRQSSTHQKQGIPSAHDEGHSHIRVCGGGGGAWDFVVIERRDVDVNTVMQYNRARFTTSPDIMPMTVNHPTRALLL
jgi:hypothetical protein